MEIIYRDMKILILKYDNYISRYEDLGISLKYPDIRLAPISSYTKVYSDIKIWYRIRNQS